MKNLIRFAATLDTTGMNKVLISEVYKAAAAKGLDMKLEEFKSQLIEAMKEGEVRLSRCDLPYLYSKEDLEASSTRHINAEFHYIRTN